MATYLYEKFEFVAKLVKELNCYAFLLRNQHFAQIANKSYIFAIPSLITRLERYRVGNVLRPVTKFQVVARKVPDLGKVLLYRCVDERYEDLSSGMTPQDISNFNVVTTSLISVREILNMYFTMWMWLCWDPRTYMYAKFEKKTFKYPA